MDTLAEGVKQNLPGEQVAELKGAVAGYRRFEQLVEHAGKVLAAQSGQQRASRLPNPTRTLGQAIA